MLIKYSENNRFLVWICLVCAFFTVFIPLCRVSVYGYEGEEGMRNSREEICFFWTEDSDGRESGNRVLFLYASPALLTAAHDGNMAVLLRFVLAKGWKIDSTQGICEGEKLHITVGNGCILLDGALVESDPVESAAVCLLKMEVSAENRQESAPPFGMQWETGDKDLLYVRNKDQSISAYAFFYCEFTDSSAESETAPPEVSSEEVTKSEADETVTEGETFESWPETEENDPVTYLGCQETPVKDGQYAVRFLFYGSVYPFIWVEGGGVLYVTVTYPDRVDAWEDGKQVFFYPDGQKRLTVCTFRGLLADRAYDFLITVNGEMYSIEYLYGKYGEK